MTKPERTPAQKAIVNSVVEVIMAFVGVGAYCGIFFMTTQSLVHRLDERGEGGNMALAISMYALSVMVISVIGYRMIERAVVNIKKNIEEA